jgi:hypothetical protein
VPCLALFHFFLAPFLDGILLQGPSRMVFFRLAAGELAPADQNGNRAFTMRDITRPQWSQLSDRERVEQGLEMLVEYNSGQALLVRSLKDLRSWRPRTPPPWSPFFCPCGQSMRPAKAIRF